MKFRTILALLAACLVLSSEEIAPGPIPGTENGSVGAGFGGVVTLKIPALGSRPQDADDYYDAFFYRHGQFVFGRRGKRLYFNFHDGSRWTVFIDSDLDFALEAGKVCQLAFALNVHRVPSQGELWTDVVLYADGREVGRRRVMDRAPAERMAPVQFACAKGFGKGWTCRAEFYSMRFFDRPPTEEEIVRLAKAEKRIRYAGEARAVIPPEIAGRLRELTTLAADLPETARPAARGLLAGLSGLAESGDIDRFSAAAEAFPAAVRSARPGACGPLQAIYGGHTMVILLPEAGRLLAWYDLENDRPLIRREAAGGFRVAFRGADGRARTLTPDAPGIRRVPFRTVSGKNGEVRWQAGWLAAEFQAEADFRFVGDSLRWDLRVTGAPGIVLTEVVFPWVRLAPLPRDGDLLVPAMSGAVKPRAMAERVGYSGYYPSGHASMQLGAWYDAEGGVYFAAEDGRARAKSLLFRAGPGGVEAAFGWPVALPASGKRAVFEPGCEAVLTRFRGDWYDAGLLYKDFLRRSAVWYRSAKPVTEYPEWFRTNTLWVSLGHKEDSARKLARLREYFGLPFAVEYVNWFGKFDRDYPHHHANPQHYLWMQDIKKMGINILPYTNGRLWETLDCRDTDYRYTTHGMPDAVKLADGSVQTEKYHGAAFAVMCPACENWRNELKALAGRVLGLNADGMYMDQIGAARPRLCFDPSHPHAPGDPDCWYMQGYRKLLLDLHKLYPQAVWTTEDNSEPYVGLMHGMLSWRWMVDGNVPLYPLCYSGRTEMVGRSFGGEDPDALAVKLFQQWMQGEQLGWCGVDFLASPPRAKFRLQVKQAMHLRLGMLDFFQRGMLDRVPEVSPQAYRRLKWGVVGDQFVSTPAIAVRAWKLGNTRLVLMVNQTGLPRRFRLSLPAAAGERRKLWTVSGSGKLLDDGEIELAPWDPAALVSAPEPELADAAARFDPLFRQVGTFSMTDDPFAIKKK